MKAEMKTPENKDLNYYKDNAEENYPTTPISVLRYITELETESASLRQEVERLKLERAEVASKIIAARDAFFKEDYNEVYHQLYSIASPDFDKEHDDVWKELEQLATTHHGKGGTEG